MFGKKKASETEPKKPDPVQNQSETPKSTLVQPGRSGVASNSRKTAMIGASIHIKGEISGDENLQIDGHVDGKVNLNNHDLTIGDTGKVNADLNAKSVKIHGEVNGDIQGSEMVLVSNTGKVLGNIVAPRVTLEDGAKFKGSIDMSPDVQPKSAKTTSMPANENVESLDTVERQASTGS